MASHYRLRRFELLPTTSVTGTNTYTSAVEEIEYFDNIYLQFDNTGSITGTYNIQVSSDHLQDQEGNVIIEGNWVTLSTTPTVSAGSPATIGVDLNQLGASYLRVQYVNSSGSGTIDIFLSAKGLM